MRESHERASFMMEMSSDQVRGIISTEQMFSYKSTATLACKETNSPTFHGSQDLVFWSHEAATETH